MHCFVGNPVLHPTLAVEKLGGRQDHCAHDGPRHWRGLGGGEEAEEEAAAGLPLRQPQESQLVGIIFFILFCSKKLLPQF